MLLTLSLSFTVYLGSASGLGMESRMDRMENAVQVCFSSVRRKLIFSVIDWSGDFKIK